MVGEGEEGGAVCVYVLTVVGLLSECRKVAEVGLLFYSSVLDHHRIEIRIDINKWFFSLVTDDMKCRLEVPT